MAQMGALAQRRQLRRGPGLGLGPDRPGDRRPGSGACRPRRDAGRGRGRDGRLRRVSAGLLRFVLSSGGSLRAGQRPLLQSPRAPDQPSELVFICAISALGYTTNRSFIQIVGLRICTEEMALDLQKQKDIAEQEQEVAEAANVAKSSFLAAASHDLRQPIHALGMFVGALRGVPVAPKGRRIVEQIEASTAAMDGLFSALLDVSRLDAGVVAVEKRAFAIGPVLERLCRDHQEEARAKGVSLVWRRCSAMVWSDPVLIERVLRNLVSNAARYTDRGRIVIGCRRRGAAVAVQVLDTGSACRQSRVRSNQGPRTGPCDRPAARQPPRPPAHAPFPAGPRLALRGDDPRSPGIFRAQPSRSRRTPPPRSREGLSSWSTTSPRFATPRSAS
jgi:signal transduction histidine kinase